MNLRPIQLRYDDEATRCPGCGAAALTHLDVMRVTKREAGARRLLFVTGCEECGLVFTNPMPPMERLSDFYSEDGQWGRARADRVERLAAAHERRIGRDKPAKSKTPRRRTLLLDAMQAWAPIVSPSSGAKVLDFGCGEGKLLDTLQDFGWETYGIEPSGDIAFIRHQRLEAPPQDRSFSLAILHHVLEHVPNPLEVMRDIAGALHDGAMLFVSVPRFDTVAVHGDFRYCINGQNHLVCFTEVCLIGLLARAGFEVVARLDTPELDEVLTKGEPLRLRLMARRSAHAVPLPETPLGAARDALRAYARAHLPVGRRMQGWMPPRLKGAFAQWMLDR